jgi:hypothetical protein
MQHAIGLKNRQHGLTMFGFFFVAAVLVAIAVLGMKLVPAYVEFLSVKKILESMGKDDELTSKSNPAIRTDFLMRATTGYVERVKPEDLIIDRSGVVPLILVDYEYRSPLVANVSLVVDFSASSDPSRMK